MPLLPPKIDTGSEIFLSLQTLIGGKAALPGGHFYSQIRISKRPKNRRETFLGNHSLVGGSCVLKKKTSFGKYGRENMPGPGNTGLEGG